MEKVQPVKTEEQSMGVVGADSRGGIKDGTAFQIDAPTVSPAAPYKIQTKDFTSEFLKGAEEATGDLFKKLQAGKEERAKELKAQNLSQYTSMAERIRSDIESKGGSVRELRKQLGMLASKSMATSPDLALVHNDLASINKNILDMYDETNMMTNANNDFLVTVNTDGTYAIKANPVKQQEKAQQYLMDAVFGNKSAYIGNIYADLAVQGITPDKPEFFSTFMTKAKPYYQLLATNDSINVQYEQLKTKLNFKEMKNKDLQDTLNPLLLEKERLQERRIEEEVFAIMQKGLKDPYFTKEKGMAEAEAIIAKIITNSGEVNDAQDFKFYSDYFDNKPEEVKKYIMGRKDYFTKLYTKGWDSAFAVMDVRTKLDVAKAKGDLDLEELRRKEAMQRLTYNLHKYTLMNEIGFENIDIAKDVLQAAGNFLQIDGVEKAGQNIPLLRMMMQDITNIFKRSPAHHTNPEFLNEESVKKLKNIPVINREKTKEGKFGTPINETVASYEKALTHEKFKILSEKDQREIVTAYVAFLQQMYKVDKAGFDKLADSLGVNPEYKKRAKGPVIKGNE